MEIPISFTLGADTKDGEPRLWLYADRRRWPPAIRARLEAGSIDAVVTLGELRFACSIKAHDGDGSRSYVAAGATRGGAPWPGHRELTARLRALGLVAGNEVSAAVEVDE